MNLLLDTHVVLWALGQSERLNSKALSALRDRANTVYVSAASAWEIAIKYALGKLSLPMQPDELLGLNLKRLGAHVLPVGLEDACAVARLPMHHGDPFDRLLIVQALRGNFTIMTADGTFSKYRVPLWKI